MRAREREMRIQYFINLPDEDLERYFNYAKKQEQEEEKSEKEEPLILRQVPGGATILNPKASHRFHELPLPDVKATEEQTKAYMDALANILADDEDDIPDDFLEKYAPRTPDYERAKWIEEIE